MASSVVSGSSEALAQGEEPPSFIATWGSFGSGAGQLSFPLFATVDVSGNVYVSDQGNHRIQKFDSTGVFLAKWGSQGTGAEQFKKPDGIAVDLSGNVYVADNQNNRIHKYDSSGSLLTTWGTVGFGDGEFNSPQGLAVDSTGNVYVADSLNNRIQKFDSSGVFLSKWGSGGGQDGQFRIPGGVAVDTLGNVYVADQSNDRIQKFDSLGGFLTKWGTEGSGAGQLQQPYGVAVDDTGDVYVVETSNHRVQTFDSSGTYLTQWGSQGSGQGQFNFPRGVTVDDSGNIYVVDNGNHRIQKVRAQVTLELDAERDITIHGIDPQDAADRVAIGDVNNDGTDDVIIGAGIAAPEGRTQAGESYVLFGPLSAGTLELSTAASITINGIDQGDRSGTDVASGDINNDGVADLIIGAIFADPGGRLNAGEAYVVFGPLSAGVLELSNVADVTINGIDPFDYLGQGVATGDINNDGVDDLILGAQNAAPGGRLNAGEAYVVFGPLLAGTLELSTAASITINGIDAGDASGTDVASGDINNDGAADLIIGASSADPGGRLGAGESYVFFGPLSAGTLELTNADITLNGIAAADFSGNVGTADVNKDTKDDVIVCATQADPGGKASAGECYIFFGPLSAGTLELSTVADITIIGIDVANFLGTDVASGDMNNDGVLDMIIAAFMHPGGRVFAGVTYVLFGTPLSTPTPPPIPGLTAWGILTLAGLLTVAFKWKRRRM